MKQVLRRREASIVLCLVILLASAGLGYAQEEASKFPSRAITYINPTAAGNPTSMAIRLISLEAEKILGQPVVEMNKPGASGTIGVGALAAAKPDGYTIGYAGHSAVFVSPIVEKVSYHPIKDLTPIIQWGGFNFGIAVKGDSPFKSFQDIVNYARKSSKKVTYGTNGSTSLQHIIVEQIGKKENVEFTHIPFAGTGEFQTALIGGHIQFAAGDFTASLIDSGQLRFLLLLRDERAGEYPKVPILKDLGYDIPCPMTQNIFAPRRIPPAIARKLEDAFARAMKQPPFIDGMKKLHMPIVYRSSKDIGEYMARNYELYARFIKEMELTQ